MEASKEIHLEMERVENEDRGEEDEANDSEEI